MSDELRQLAHAIKALAESNQGIGGVLREEVVSRLETNRILAAIFDQNAAIHGLMEQWNVDKRESERAIRALQSDVKRHDQRLGAVEKIIGVGAGKHPGTER